MKDKDEFLRVRVEVEKIYANLLEPTHYVPTFSQDSNLSDTFKAQIVREQTEKYQTDLAYHNNVSEEIRKELLRERLVRDEPKGYDEITKRVERDEKIMARLARGDNRSVDEIRRTVMLEEQHNKSLGILSPSEQLNRDTEQLLQMSNLGSLGSDEPIRCPLCGSAQISSDRKGFGVGKALVGGVVAGPVGLLAGNIGGSKVKITCLKCGHRWEPGS